MSEVLTHIFYSSAQFYSSVLLLILDYIL